MTHLKRLLLGLTMAALLPLSIAHADPLYLLDFVIMNEGYGIEERNNYEAIIEPISGKYGAKIIRSYDLKQHLGGAIPNAIRLNVWELPDGAMQKLQQDPDYQALVAYRDRIHSMADGSLFMATESLGKREPTTDTIMVDLVVMQDGYGLEEREAYERKMAPIGAKYGVEKFATYDILQKVGGAAPDGLRVNLWAVPDPSAMAKAMSDPDYQKLIPRRDQIHRMDLVTLFFAKQAD